MKPIFINNEETNYLIDENGTIINKITNNKLQTHTIKCGYVLAQLNVKGKKYNRYVHRLVAEAFCELDVTSKQFEVDHIDSNRLNNNYLNLRLVTRQENMRIVWEEKGDQIRKNMKGKRKTYKVERKRFKLMETNYLGEIIKIYDNINIAADELNLSISALRYKMNYKFQDIIAWRENGKILLYNFYTHEADYVTKQQIRDLEKKYNINIKIRKYQPKRYFTNRFKKI